MSRRGAAPAAVPQPAAAHAPPNGAAAAPGDAAGRFSCDVRLFAWLAELANARSVTIDLPAGACAAVAVARALRAAGLEDSFGIGGSLRLAVNREYVAAGDVIEAGDELALIPPVSGGAPVHVRITGEPLNLNALHDSVLTEASGAVVTFTGVTCDVQNQHYESYAEMAQEQIEKIAAGLLERYRLEAVAIEHRVGDVPPGQPSLIVAVSARRRPAAFSAAHEAIDRIKTDAPIWKLEVDGAGYRSWDRGEPTAFERFA